MGASHAQRDVFAQLLNESALRGRRFRLARGLLAERVELRPRSADSWSKYAEALDGCGEAEAGAAARVRADECRAAGGVRASASAGGEALTGGRRKPADAASTGGKPAPADRARAGGHGPTPTEQEGTWLRP